MVETEPARVVIGRVGAAYGVRGEVRVQSFTRPVENLQAYRDWVLDRSGARTSVHVLSLRRHGDGFIAEFDGCGDRDDAARLAGALITIPRDALPPAGPGQIYWSDLVGMQVVNAEGIDLGVVERLIEVSGTDVLVVRAGLRERMIPYLPGRYILELDLPERRIRADWHPDD
ncbi:MAG: ribosome maturation factor RimM [Gammaproteobacteria bacterium]